MERHPETSNSGKPVPALGLTSSQNSVTDVQRDVYSLERAGAVKEATSNRCKSREEFTPAQPWQGSQENKDKYNGSSPISVSDFLLVYTGQTQPEDRRQKMPGKSICRDKHSNLLPVPTSPHSKEQRRAEMDLEDQLITNSVVVLKY